MTAPETQPERTALAWQRLGLAVLAVAGLLAHGAVLEDSWGLFAAAAGLAAVALLVLSAVAPLRYRRILGAVRSGTAAGTPRLAALATLVVLAAAGTAAVAVLSSL